MKKYFDPDQVMQSLRKMAVHLEEATETDTTLADAFFRTMQAFKTERRRSSAASSSGNESKWNPTWNRS